MGLDPSSRRQDRRLSPVKYNSGRDQKQKQIYMYVYDCRSADERATRDGTRRSAVGSVTSVNSPTVKRLFTEDSDHSATTCDADTKRLRRVENDAELYTLKVCNNIAYSCWFALNYVFYFILLVFCFTF